MEQHDIYPKDIKNILSENGLDEIQAEDMLDILTFSFIAYL